MSRTTTLIAIALGAICLACGDEKEPEEHGHAPGEEHDGEHGGATSLTATLAPKSGNTTLAGKAVFSGATGKVQIKVDLTGAPAGEHGLHIHAMGDCSDDVAMNAGPHWNPTMHEHGKLGTGEVHHGDVGNITVAADGTGTLTVTNPLWEIGTGTANDVKGHAVVVHANPDDFVTKDTGNAGPRIGCGVIE
jgi:superoxide dismutase, Cu-Zn family